MANFVVIVLLLEGELLVFTVDSGRRLLRSENGEEEMERLQHRDSQQKSMQIVT